MKTRRPIKAEESRVLAGISKQPSHRFLDKIKQNTKVSMTKDMAYILKKLLILASFFIPIHGYAQGIFSEIDGVILYSEYYPNPKSEFKGTIVFQNGSGSSLKAWTQNKTFLNCVRQYSNALMYDRSGLGQSPPDFRISSEKPITAQLVNSKLIKLLKRNDRKSPYILVSHSYGGMYAGHFARKHPDLIAGMLMVDPVPSNYQYSTEILENFEYTREKLKNISSEEAYQLINRESPKESKMMTADSFYQQLGFDQTKTQVAELPETTDKFPIIIVSSSDMTKNTSIKGDWYALQKQWLNQNPESLIFQAQGGHFLQFDQPKLICGEIKKLVEKAIQSSK